MQVSPFAFCLASGLVDCGGGSNGGGGGKTPPGTTVLTVTGTFTGGQGTLNHVVSLKLTVN